MLSITSLIKTVSTEHPSLTFAPGTDDRWSPQESTVYYSESTSDTAAFLHELAHALLNHTDYDRDITLMAMERDAWTYASNNLAMRYDTPISDDTVQDALDTYRDWLHARSLCPNCGATGVQSQKYAYKCIACHSTWRVNDARMCALRRYRQ